MTDCFYTEGDLLRKSAKIGVKLKNRKMTSYYFLTVYSYNI